jgi:hypothetical protein
MSTSAVSDRLWPVAVVGSFRPVADIEPYRQKSANFAHIMPKYPSTAPIRLASATPSSGQCHKADNINEAMTPNDIRPIALDLIFKSESGSKAYIPPSKNPRQPKEPVPSNACRHDMSVHGAAYDSAAQALIIEKRTVRIIALRNVVMIGLCEKLICGAGQCKELAAIGP